MQKFKFTKPYRNGKPAFPLRNKSGLYIIKEGKEIVYIGYSGRDLYKTMYRHFQEWNHTGQEVVTYAGQDLNRFTVRIVYCSPGRAAKLEKLLIAKHEPRDNVHGKHEEIPYEPTKSEMELYQVYTDLNPEPLTF